MNYSRQYLAELSTKTNFIKDNLEKVLRLSEILKFLNTDKVFKGKLALKGGTAINLTEVELPRLSVDIDLDFTENLSNAEIEKVKSKFTKRLNDYMWQEGYSITQNSMESHALLSFVFNYINSAGNRDNIKIEINFMNCCHILPLETKKIISKGIINPFEILTLNTIELYASKINALLSRATPRDLYDVNTMIEQNIISDKVLLKKCLIFYNMVGGNKDIDILNFDNINRIDYNKFKTQLKPVISKSDKFNLVTAKENVISYVKELIKFDFYEKKFISNFRANIFMPNLLFDTQEHTFNSLLHPMALWRCKDGIDLSKIQIDLKSKDQSSVEVNKFLSDYIIDNSNADELQKMCGKLLTSFIKESAKQENDLKWKQYAQNIIKSIVHIDIVKRKLYSSQIPNEEKKEIAYNFDKMILKLELGNYLNQDEEDYFNTIKRKLTR